VSIAATTRTESNRKGEIGHGGHGSESATQRQADARKQKASANACGPR